MSLIYRGLDIMGDTKDRLNNPRPDVYISELIGFIAEQYPNLTHIGISVPMNTSAERVASMGQPFAIEPAVYAKKFCDAIHANGKKVLWRGTDCFFEGLYSMSKASKNNGTRYSYFGLPITDNFSSDVVRNHGYGKESAAGNISTNYLTSHQASNTWTIVNGELTGPSANGWVRSCLFNAPNISDVTMVAKVKKVGNQQIMVRASTDQNFPGYGLQMRGTDTLRVERPGLANLGEVTTKNWVTGNYYWLKLQAIGTAIKGKAWADGESEPGSWDIEITDATYSNGYCGFSGESNSGKFDDMTITPNQKSDTWLSRACDWISANIDLFESGDQIACYPEASSHHNLTNQGTYNQFFVDLKYCLDVICAQNNIECENGFSSHIWTSVIQQAIGGQVFTIPGMVSFDHYGTSIGLGKRFTSFTHGSSGASNTYTVPTSITENATNRHDFIPEKISYNTEIDVYIVDKGTGDWTMTIHKSNNDPVQMPNPHDLTDLTSSYQVTIPNASLTNGALNTFYVNWDNPDTDVTYHFHLTSTVGDGTIKTTTANDLNTLYCIGYKINAIPDQLEIDLRKTYSRQGNFPLYLQEWGDYWSTDSSRSDPVRNQAQHEEYLDSMYSMFKRLINENILKGFQYWRAIGGHEGIMTNTGTEEEPDFQLLYEGIKFQDFLRTLSPRPLSQSRASTVNRITSGNRAQSGARTFIS